MDKMMEFANNSFPFDHESSMMDVAENNFIENPNKTQHTPSLYLLKENPPPVQMTGSTNLITHFGLESTYNKFCGKKLKESLSSFLPDLPGVIDTPGDADGSSLRLLIEKPPIVGSKEIRSLSDVLMASFRLHPGPLPEQYRPLYQQNDTRRRHKHHKNKNRPDTSVHDSRAPEMEESKKHKKRKHEDGEKKKKKKDKKKKKEREKDRS